MGPILAPVEYLHLRRHQNHRGRPNHDYQRRIEYLRSWLVMVMHCDACNGHRCLCMDGCVAIVTQHCNVCYVQY